MLLPPSPSAQITAGVGASAGGLEAMLAMFAGMLRTGRIAYVVAQHMMHDGHSELVARLIGRESALPAVVGDSGTRLQADTIYVIPAGKDGCVRSAYLELSDPAAQNISTPSVNVLFRSIAEAHGSNAIGIVLSGAGSDGTIGCRAIKSRLGVTIAQDPAEAKFSGMPSAAIAARVIDRVLGVHQIGATVAKLYSGLAAVAAENPTLLAGPHHKADRALPGDPPVNEAQHEELQLLLPQILDATGIDFSNYKEDTLFRRLEKRKSSLGLHTAVEYRALISRDPGELRILQHLFLVSVSSFFRDRESFVLLKRSLASLVLCKAEEEPIRVWVPGCASGEECYTLAILLLEILRELHLRRPISITGADLNPEALEIAAEGVYGLSGFKEIDSDLLSRYFLRAGTHLSLKPEVKSCVAFERQDVLTGPPASGLDLVSCRNLLIYLKSPLQDRLIRIFYDALRPEGLLFMGESESLSFTGSALFATVDYVHRLFRRRDRDSRTHST